jgi:hypothetical protein
MFRCDDSTADGTHLRLLADNEQGNRPLSAQRELRPERSDERKSRSAVEEQGAEPMYAAHCD